MNVMQQNNYSITKPCFTVYTDVLTDEECDEICERQINNEVIREDIEFSYSNFLNKTEKFSYDVSVLEDSEDIEKKLISYVFDCNSKIYGYEIWGIEENPRILTFKENDFIDMHEKISWYSSEPNDKKLTGYLFLSNSRSYNGGKFKVDPALEIPNISNNYNTRGNLLIYPSFVTLSISKITSGFMQLLTFDIIGPKLR